MSNTIDAHALTGVDGYQTTRNIPSIVHTLATGGIAISLRPGKPRSGTLDCHLATEAAALALLNALATPGTHTFATTEMAGGGMTFVVTGDVDLGQDSARTEWIVRVPYQETP